MKNDDFERAIKSFQLPGDLEMAAREILVNKRNRVTVRRRYKLSLDSLTRTLQRVQDEDSRIRTTAPQE